MTAIRMRHGLTLLSLATLLSGCSAPPAEQPIASQDAPPPVRQSALPAAYLGYLEYAGCEVILGWAYNANDADAPLAVDLLEGDAKLGTAQADVLRNDLVAAARGNGKHSFRFTVPASLQDGKLHNIQAKVSGTDYVLVQSPKSLGPCTAH